MKTRGSWAWMLAAILALGSTGCNVSAIADATATDSTGTHGTGTGAVASSVTINGITGGALTSGDCGGSQSVQLVAVVKDQNGNVINVPVTFSFGDQASAGLATLTQSGLLTANNGASDTVHVIVTVDGTSITGAISIPINACPSSSSLSFSPQNGQLAVGQSDTLTVSCTGTFCGNLTLESSDGSVIVTDILQKTITCLKAGTATITLHPSGAKTPSFSGSWTCVPASSNVTGVTISPLNPTIPLVLVNGVCQATGQFVATVSFSSGLPSTTYPVTWSGANSSGFFTASTAGPYTVSVSVPGTNFTAASHVTVTGSCTVPTGLTSNFGSVNVANCSGFVQTYTPEIRLNGTVVTNGTWTFTSSGASIGSATSNGFTLNGTVGTGSARVSVPNPNGGNPLTLDIPVTVTACPSSGSITVTPNPLNIALGQIGQLTATLGGGLTGVPTWASTSGCISFDQTQALIVNVQGARVCRDSVVAQIGTVKGWAIVNVTPGAACTLNGPSTLGVPNTASASANCGLNQPYWWSRNPEIAGILGAPFVCTIGTMPWPCGPTATIKAVAAGSTQYCVQPAVQDPTSPVCNNLTVTAASGDLIPNDKSGVELDIQKQLGITWAKGPKPAGKAFDKVIPMAEYIQMVKSGLIKPNKQ